MRARLWAACEDSPITAPAVVDSPSDPRGAVPAAAVMWPMMSTLRSPWLSAESVMTSSTVLSTVVVVDDPAGKRTSCSDMVTEVGSSNVPVTRARRWGVPWGAA